MNRISYSQLSMYNECPLRWKLNYVDKLSISEPNIHLIFGTAMHTVLQKYLEVMYHDSAKNADILNLEEMLRDEMILRFNQDMDFSTFTLGDTRTTWDATKTYSIGDIIEYNGAEYSSNVDSNINQVPPTSTSYWTATSNVAVLTAGSGSIKFKNTTTGEFETGGTLSYTNKLLTYTPAENMIASNIYQITIVGQNTSAMYPTIGSSVDHVSPVENTSGIAMASTFQSTFTINTAGNSTATLTVSSAAGTIKTPSYTVAELNALAAFYSANDQGSQAWCSNETGGACMVVYNGTNWVRIDNSNVIQA